MSSLTALLSELPLTIWHPASSSRAEELSTRTMSVEEVRRSYLLTAVDIVGLFVTGIVATRYWLDTRSRLRYVRMRQRMDASPVACRALFLKLLGAANMSRALCLIATVSVHRHTWMLNRTVFRHHHEAKKHHFFANWHHCIDFLFSSLPTMIWISTLSVLLLFVVEIYYRTMVRRIDNLWMTVVFINAAAYLLYVAVAFLTLKLATYKEFRLYIYFLLCCLHVSVAVALLNYGLRLALLLKRRPASAFAALSAERSKQKLKQTQAHNVGPSLSLIRRIALIASLLPVTEMIRAFNDFSYSTGMLPFNLSPDVSSVFYLAVVKLFTEWVPSMVLLYAFRPESRQEDRPSSSALIDPLLSLDRPQIGSSPVFLVGQAPQYVLLNSSRLLKP